MRYRVTGKQPNSRMCLVCGLENTFGLHTAFYELKNGELLGIFSPKEEHQGYPGRLHGGIASAILDETIGRAILMRHEGQLWGMTTELTLRFRRPVPLDDDLKVRARITNDARRHFEGSGEILLDDGTVAVEGRGRFIKVPLDQIGEFDPIAEQWRVVPNDADPESVDLA